MPRSAPTEPSRRGGTFRHVLLALFLGSCSARHVPEVDAPHAADPTTRPPAPAHVREVIRAVAGAELRDVRAATAGEGPLYLVEVELALANPGDLWAEADLALRLPPDARIARLALEVGGALREAVVLPRDDATTIYGGIVRRRRDPALLERAADGSLRLRVAPIPGYGRAGVVFSYVGLARGRPFAVHRDERWIVRTSLPAPTLAPAPRRLRVLLDTSASMQPRFPEHLQRARELLAALAGHYAQPVALELVAFDQSIEPVYDGPLAAIPESVWTGLRARGALGATRGAEALKAPTQADRILIITDGRFTGPDAALLAGADALARAGVDRLDVVTLADRPAEPTPSLRALRDRVHLAQRGLVEWRPAAPARLARRLAGEVRDVRLDVPGATWWSPRTVELGVDDDVTLLVRSPKAPAPVLRGPSDGDVPLALAGEAAGGPLFERMWHALVVDAELAQADPDPAALAALAQRAAELGVLTPLTAFLALESESQEKEYGVTRSSAPVLTIERGEVVVRPPIGTPPHGVTLSSVADGASAPAEFSRSAELERRARLIDKMNAFEKAISATTKIRERFERGEIAGLDGLRAELDALLRSIEQERGAESALAFLRPFAQRLLDSRGDPCHFAELERALTTFAIGVQPHGAGAEPSLTSTRDQLPRELTPQTVLEYAGALAGKGRGREAARALGSLADLTSPLAAAVALATLPEGHAQAAALLRELVDATDPNDVRRQLLIQRLLAASLADTGAFAEAFALLAAQLPVVRLRDDDSFTPEAVAREGAQLQVAADLRLLGARWAAHEPRRAAAIARDVKRLAGPAPADALVIVAFYFGPRRLTLHSFDGRGSASVAQRLHRNIDRDDDLQTTVLPVRAAELPSALEIGGGQRGEWVRIDMYDKTGPKISVESRLIVLSGPRTRLDLPPHLLGGRVCPPVKPP